MTREYKENGIITFISYCICHPLEIFVICFGVLYILYYSHMLLVWIFEQLIHLVG